MSYYKIMYKFKESHKHALLNLYDEDPKFFSKFESRNDYYKYLSQEFDGCTLYGIDDFMPCYVLNNANKGMDNRKITRIVECNIFGNIIQTIINLN